MGILQALQRILNNLGFQTDVNMFFVLFALAVARIVTAVSLSPFLGGTAVPARVKMGLSVILAALLYPSLAAQAAIGDISPLMLVGLLVKEAMIGATIGVVCQLIFYAVQMAGILIDTQRGMNQIAFFAPQLPGHTSVLGQLKFQAALALFLSLGGHLLFLRALHSSFQQLPLAAFPQFQAGLAGLTEQLIRISAGTLVVAVQLSAPVLLALFLVDVAFGAIGKVAPQVHVHNESQPVKAMAGLVIVFLTAALLLGRLQTHFVEMIRHISEVLARIA